MFVLFGCDGFGRCGVISEIPLLLFWNPNRESVNPDTGQCLLAHLLANDRFAEAVRALQVDWATRC
jgi:hypothetical protein